MLHARDHNYRSHFHLLKPSFQCQAPAPSAGPQFEDSQRLLEAEVGQTAQGGLVAVAELAMHADAEVGLAFRGRVLRARIHFSCDGCRLFAADEKRWENNRARAVLD